MGQEAPGCLGAIFGWLGLGGAIAASGDSDVPQMDVYRMRDDFLSPAEASFFRVLRLAVGENYLVCPKVRLGDLFYVTRPNENRGALNRIVPRHVDFLLCDPSSLKPLLGLELDDASHQRARNAERDRFKDDLFAAAGLPLVRVPVRNAYEPAQLLGLLAQALPSPPKASDLNRNEPTPVIPAPEASAAEAPPCPKCGVPMALRTAQRGDSRGSRFWGCVNYPKCRQVITTTEEQGVTA